MSEWQPIETAPRNGTIIILTDGRFSHAGWFSNVDPYYPWQFIDDSKMEKPGDYDGDRMFVEPNGYPVNNGPKYWMPFPKAPCIST